MKGLNWNEIIRFPYSVSSLNEALLCVTRNRVSKQILVVRTDDKPWFDDRCVLAHSAKQRAYRMWSCSKTQADPHSGDPSSVLCFVALRCSLACSLLLDQDLMVETILTESFPFFQAGGWGAGT